MPNTLQSLNEYELPDIDWDNVKGPIAFIDGTVHRVAEIDTKIDADTVFVSGMNAKNFERFCKYVRAHTLQFSDMRVEELSPLARFGELKQLAIRWNTKVQDISFLHQMPQLETLVLDDTKKVRDLSPLTSLKKLRAFAFTGGMWSKNRANSLEPISELLELRELELINLFVESGGLKPIARCTKLERMLLSNQFDTEDYAYLAAKLPNIECDRLAPYVTLVSPIDGKDVMVIGKRKPFLNSREDAEQLERYVAEFEALKESFCG